MRRILGLGVLAPLVVTVVAAAMSAGQSEAATPFATCTRSPDGSYICDRAISVGRHIALAIPPRVCHGDVTTAAGGTGGLAKVRITENVSSCPWVGSVMTINYSVAPAPGSPVGGSTEVYVSAANPMGESASGWPDYTVPVALATAAALTLITGAVCGGRWLRHQRGRPGNAAGV